MISPNAGGWVASSPRFSEAKRVLAHKQSPVSTAHARLRLSPSLATSH